VSSALKARTKASASCYFKQGFSGIGLNHSDVYDKAISRDCMVDELSIVQLAGQSIYFGDGSGSISRLLHTRIVANSRTEILQRELHTGLGSQEA
jgi:hypothetical protein